MPNKKLSDIPINHKEDTITGAMGIPSTRKDELIDIFNLIAESTEKQSEIFEVILHTPEDKLTTEEKVFLIYLSGQFIQQYSGISKLFGGIL